MKYGILIRYTDFVEVEAEDEQEAFDIALEGQKTWVSDLEMDEAEIQYIDI